MDIDCDGRSWSRIVLAAIGMLVFSACNGGGCDIDGFTEQSFPDEHIDKGVAGSAEVRVTSHGLDFMSGQIDNLLAEFMDDGLSFCVPPTYTDDADICHEDTQCADGSTGCQIDLTIDEADLVPESPNRLVAEITIGNLHEDIPVTIHIWPNPDCWLELYGDSSDEPAQIPVTAPVIFEVDTSSPFNDVYIDVGELTVDIDGVDYNLSGRGGSSFSCGTYGWIAGAFLDGMLRDMIADEINDAVDELTREELCRSCGDDDLPCPSNSTCNEGDDDEAAICMYDEEECVPMLLGIEGVLELQELIGDFVPDEPADVFVTGRVAERVEADSGLTLAATTASQPDDYTRCVPVVTDDRPPFDSIAPSASINDDYTPEGDEFMFGFGMHRYTIEHLLWSIWASGSLCAEVGSEQVDLLTINAFSALIDGIDDIATKNGPMQIRLAPQEAMDVRLGANTVEADEVTDGLLTVEWRDLDLHMYGYVQERFARLFTLRVDLELPIAVVPEDGGLLPVLGDFEKSIENMRVLNDNLVSSRDEDIFDLVPMLLGIAVPELMDSLDEPIELPEFFGYKIVIEDGDLRAVDDDDYLGLFANLEYVGDLGGQLLATPPRAIITGQELTIEDGARRVPQVSLALDVTTEPAVPRTTGDEIEYLYRLGDRPWRLAGTGTRLHIEEPMLALQGSHQLELRARHAFGGARWQGEPTSTEFVVDYQAPTVEAWQQGDELMVRAEDSVDTVDEMEMRYRYVVDDRPGDWSDWDDVDAIGLDETPAVGALGVDIEVRDRAGWVGADRVDVNRRGLEASGVDEPADFGGEPSAGGCSSVSNGNKGFLLVLIVALAMLATRFRRRLGAGLLGLPAISLVVAVAFAASGCGGCGDEVPSQEDCPDECDQGQACVAGECIVPTCDDIECLELSCPDPAEVGVCDGDECVCQQPCPDGCDSNEYCCHGGNSCEPIPNWCHEVTCDPGYAPEVSHIGEIDHQACRISDGECECILLDPIPIDYHGSYPSLAHDGQMTVVAVHNSGYGDLMVGILNNKSEVEHWYFVDGVPVGASVGGDPDGPRGGVRTSGLEVGTHTATAIDDDGQIHVFYRSESEETLKYARGQQSGDDWSFETTVVEDDDDIDSGYFSAVHYHEGQLHLFYTVRLEDGGTEENPEKRSELRHRSIDVNTDVEAMSETDFEMIHFGASDEQGRESTPRIAALYLQLVEDDDGNMFLSFFDNTTAQIGWMSADGHDWSAPTFFGDQVGPYVSARPGADGVIHFAYMDESKPALMYQVDDGEPEEIIGGVRDHSGGWSQMSVGHDVELHVDGDSIEVLYHDASTHELRRGVRSGDDDWSVDILAGEAGELAPAHGMYVRSIPVDGGRLVVDFMVDTRDLEYPVGEPAFRIVD